MKDCEPHDWCSGRFDQIDRKLGEILETLHGNGHPGIKTRLDRLEQSNANRAKFMWALFLSVLTVVGNWVYGLIKG